MAISEDTVALVAAQLTAAWASRVAGEPRSPRETAEGRVLAVYRHFAGQVRGTDTYEHTGL